MSNVKAGDLAIVVRSEVDAANIGTLVDVLRPARPGAWWVRLHGHIRAPSKLDGRIAAYGPGATGTALDACLRPIRDGEGDDETLTWAGKPTEEQDRLWAEFDTAISEREVAQSIKGSTP